MTTRIVIVGAGPRCAGIVQALGRSNLPSVTEVLIVGRAPADDGAPWRAGQSSHVLANSFADQITLAGPEDSPGTFLEWCRRVGPGRSGWGADDNLRREAAAMTSTATPSRRLVGRYIDAVISAGAAAGGLSLRWVLGNLATVDADRPESVSLTDGRRFRADAVILATGVDDAGPGVLDAVSRPITLDKVPGAGSRVLVRGLGLTFHDVVAQLTVGRGGRFEPTPHGPRYVASGREPEIWATSRTGVPVAPKLASVVQTPMPTDGEAGVWLVERSTDSASARTAVLDLLTEVLAPLRQGHRLAEVRDRSARTAVAAARQLDAEVAEVREASGRARAAHGAVVAALESVVPAVLSPPPALARNAAHALAVLEEVGSRLTSGPPGRRTLELAALVDVGLIRLAGGERSIRPSARGWHLDTPDGWSTGFEAFVDARVRPRPATWVQSSRLPLEASGRVDVDPTSLRVRRGPDGGGTRCVFVAGPVASVGGLAMLPRPGGAPDFFDQNAAIAAAVTASFVPRTRSTAKGRSGNRRCPASPNLSSGR